MTQRRDLVRHLQDKANVIRRDIVKMIYKADSGHPGGALSAADIVAVLYFHVMHIDPKNPKWEYRDRFILSKGHSCPVVYSALSQLGYFSREKLWTLRDVGSILQGHPDMRKTPGIDMTTGSLGHGLSAGVGIAIAGKLDQKSYRVFVMLGDGEIQEGQVWEAAMSASHYKLDNLVAIVDYNKLQVDGFVDRVMSIEPLVDKWRAFGWYTMVIDGHNIEEIIDAFQKIGTIYGRPSVIIAHTIKGKGISFMENQVEWHCKTPTAEQMKQVMKDLAGEDGKL